jgi:hypothetical protein
MGGSQANDSRQQDAGYSFRLLRVVESDQEKVAFYLAEGAAPPDSMHIQDL